MQSIPTLEVASAARDARDLPIHAFRLAAASLINGRMALMPSAVPAQEDAAVKTLQLEHALVHRDITTAVSPTPAAAWVMRDAQDLPMRAFLFLLVPA